MADPVKVIGFKELNNYKVKHLINTTSRSESWTKEFSPFTLGPVNLYGGFTAKNLENAWQFTKVYKEHVDSNNDPTESYFRWAKKGWNDNFAHRYPMGKGSVPLYSYWNNQKLGYVDARKKIYVPLYAKSVVKTTAFEKLVDIYESGDSFALLDFDGYDYLNLGMTLRDVADDPKRKMGHAFVLATLLENKNLRLKLGSIK